MEAELQFHHNQLSSPGKKQQTAKHVRITVPPGKQLGEDCKRTYLDSVLLRQTHRIIV